MDIFIKKSIQFYLNNTTNLHSSTPQNGYHIDRRNQILTKIIFIYM